MAAIESILLRTGPGGRVPAGAVMGLKLEGLGEFERGLEALPGQLIGGGCVARVVGGAVRKEAQPRMPHRTGHLASTVVDRPIRGGSLVEVGVYFQGQKRPRKVLVAAATKGRVAGAPLPTVDINAPIPTAGRAPWAPRPRRARGSAFPQGKYSVSDRPEGGRSPSGVEVW